MAALGKQLAKGVKRGGRKVRTVLGLADDTSLLQTADSALTHFRPRSTRNSSNDVSIRIPFSNLGVPIITDVNGIPYFGGTQVGFDLDPNAPIAGYYPFGLNVGNVVSNFRRWRLLSLQVRYEPAVSTSDPGSMVIACTTETAGAVTSAPGAGALDSMEGATIVPLGQRANLRFPITRDWLYVIDESGTGAGGGAAARQQDAGTVYRRVLNNSSVVSGTVGFLQMTGVIECKTLGSPPTLVSSPPLPLSQATSSPPLLSSTPRPEHDHDPPPRLPSVPERYVYIEKDPTGGGVPPRLGRL